MFLVWLKLKKACRTHGLSSNAQLQATVNRSCIGTLHDVMEITNAKPCKNSE
jgi:hypothetical protein